MKQNLLFCTLSEKWNGRKTNINNYTSFVMSTMRDGDVMDTTNSLTHANIKTKIDGQGYTPISHRTNLSRAHYGIYEPIFKNRTTYKW